MNIRKTINNSKLGKLINGISIGKWFERSDFAFVVEHAVEDCEEVLRHNKNFPERLGAYLYALSIPLSVCIGYPTLKIVRLRGDISQRSQYNQNKERWLQERKEVYS